MVNVNQNTHHKNYTVYYAPDLHPCLLDLLSGTLNTDAACPVGTPLLPLGPSTSHGFL